MKRFFNSFTGVRKVFLICFLLGNMTVFGQAPADIALEHLRSTAETYGLSADDVKEYLISDVSTSRHNGVSHVYLRQAFSGIPIYQGTVNVNVTAEGKVFSMGNQSIAGIAEKANATTPEISPEDAIAAAATVYGLGGVNGVEFISSPTGAIQSCRLTGGTISQEEIPCQLMYFEDEAGSLRLTWDLSILEMDGDHWWSLRIDALTGEVLDAYDWIRTCRFEAEFDSNWECLDGDHDHDHVQAAAVPEAPSFMAAPPPNSYNVFADPVESPNHGGRTVVSTPWNLLASPFGWHDDDGVVGAEYNITRGNNVWAQDDQNGNNGTGTSANGGPTLDFNFPIDFSQQPNTYLDAANTNLFYINNRMHDIWYQYGFDEASGNFQENNYGRGGAASDFVFADAQDGSGFNNANFGTPPDGNNPRMQMFLWTGQTVTNFFVNSPASIAASYFAVEAGFGPGLTTTPVTGNLVLVDDGTANGSEGCNALINGGALNNNIALIDRGNCPFVDKVLNAQNAGADACIVCNNAAGAPFAMGGANGAITIPSVMISQADCAIIRAQLGSGVNVSLSNSGPAVDRDGDFDNGIIAHEYGHGISNRLVGGRNNTNCLGNSEQMGEGWSDFFGLIMTMEPTDAGTDRRGIGTFAIFQPTTGDGIRPAPYTTDMSVNPFTYGDITNAGVISQPHGIGFLFCNMLWEMTWALTDAIGFDPDFENGTGGNNIAMQLVSDGMKLMPCNPGFVDARDAILEADTLNYSGAFSCLIWQAFAKRGLGLSATQGSSNNRSDGSEAFDLPVCTPLPVQWTDLAATPEDNMIQLDWEVAQEIENLGFEVQRRSEDEQGFREIGFVSSQGPTTESRSYDYPDLEVEPGIRYFYRLRQVDADGQQSFSKTVSAILPGTAPVSLDIYPNPSPGRTTLKIGGAITGPVRVSVFNMLGQEILNNTFEMDASGKANQIILDGAPAGSYMVKVQTNSTTVSKRLVIE